MPDKGPVLAPSGGSDSPGRVPIHTTLAILAGGLAVAAGAGAWYAALNLGSARSSHEVLDLAATVATDALRAEVSCQRYLMSGDSRSLADYRDSLRRARQAAKDLSASASRLHLGEVMLAPAIAEAMGALDAWQDTYAVPATNMKREGQSQKLSALNRKPLSSSLSNGLRDSLESLRERTESAMAANSARTAGLGRIALGLMALGIAAAAAVSGRFYRRVRTALADLRSHGEALELLAHWSERIQRIYSDDQAARMLAGTLTGQAGMARATVLFKSPEGNLLQTAADSAATGHAFNPPPEAQDCADCPAVQDGQGVLVVQGEHDHACNCSMSGLAKGSYMCVPLTAKGGVVGVVRTESPVGVQMDRPLLDRVQSLVRLTSITLNTLLTLADAKQQATMDGLTGIFNRRFLDAYLDKQVQLAMRNGQPLTVLMMDLDRFKSFNDRYGHAAGDALLRAFAAALAGAVREGDLAARYGGEEFTAVLPGTGGEEARHIAERIREAAERVRLEILPNLEPPVMTVSIGLAEAPADGQNAKALLGNADAALYRAKEGGRNRVIASR